VIAWDEPADWKGAGEAAKRNGYELDVHGSNPEMGATDKTGKDEFEKALKTSDVVIYVGHGIGNSDNVPYVPTYIVIGGNTAYGSGGSGVPSGAEYYPTGPKPEVTAPVFGNFSCNSNANTSAFFTFKSKGQQFTVTVDSGEDGYTAVGTLENAAKAFVQAYASTKGTTEAKVAAGTAAANKIIEADRNRKFGHNHVGDKVVAEPVKPQ